MKKIAKGLLLCLTVSALGITSVHAGGEVRPARITLSTDNVSVHYSGFASDEIKAAEFTDTKIILDENSVLLLNRPICTITREDNSEPELFLPVEATLEALGYGVEWSKEKNTVELTAEPGKDTEFTVFIENDIITTDTTDHKMEFEVLEAAGNDISFAETCRLKVLLDGASVTLTEAFVSIWRERSRQPVLYMQWDELLNCLGFGGSYNEGLNTVELQSGKPVEDDVVMYISEENITTDTEEINLIVTYNIERGYLDQFIFSGAGLFGGRVFYLEKAKDGAWKHTSEHTGAELRNCSEERSLNYDNENEDCYIIDLKKYYNQLTPGSYRIVKSYCTIYAETFYYAEFEVLNYTERGKH